MVCINRLKVSGLTCSSVARGLAGAKAPYGLQLLYIFLL